MHVRQKDPEMSRQATKLQCVAVAVSVATVLTLAACSSSSGSNQPSGGTPAAGSSSAKTVKITLAADLALSGQVGPIGTQVKQGIDLGIKDAEKQFPQLDIGISYYDDQFASTQAATNYSEIVPSRPTAIIGPLGSLLASATLPIAQQAGILDMAIVVPNSQIVNIGNQIYYTTPEYTEAQAAALLDALTTNGATFRRPALMISEQTLTEHQFADVMTSALKARNIKVAASVEDDSTAINYSADISKVLSADPDTVFVLGPTTSTPEIVRQLRAAGYKGTIAGDTGLVPDDFPAGAGAAANGVIALTFYNGGTSGSVSQKFVREYQAAYHSAPSFYSAQGYDAVVALTNAIVKAGSTDNAAIRRVLNTLVFNGALGNGLSFSTDRTIQVAPIIVKWQNGNLVSAG
jgi:branched-chain amino acid transport system substrate-binding protein